MTTHRFHPVPAPPTHIGGAVPCDGIEQYCLEEASDEELKSLINGDLTPNWLIKEAEAELEERDIEEGL